MYRFLETFRIEGDRIENLPFHRERIIKTLTDHYGCDAVPGWVDRLEEIPLNFESGRSGISKGRFLYGGDNPLIHSGEIACEPYLPRKVGKLHVVICDPLPEYRYKYADRSVFGPLLNRLDPCEEVVICDKDGLLTDTSYTNILLTDGNIRVTPAAPLLRGTRRARLLAEGLITEEHITIKEIKYFREIHLINALLAPGDLVLPVGCIYC